MHQHEICTDSFLPCAPPGSVWITKGRQVAHCASVSEICEGSGALMYKADRSDTTWATNQAIGKKQKVRNKNIFEFFH